MHANTDKFQIRRGVRQGDNVSPKLFTTLLEYAFKQIDWQNWDININGENLNHLFADDIVLISDNIGEAIQMLKKLQEMSERGLTINVSKTKFMTNLVTTGYIIADNLQIEEVRSYKYLGHEV